MQHSTGEMLIAKRGGGLMIVNLKTQETSAPKANSEMQLNKDAIVFADESKVDASHNLYTFFSLNTMMADKLRATLGIESHRSGSTAANIVAVATGNAALDIGATRKGNLEFASGYAIIYSAGGVMETVSGKDIGDELFLEFGQKEHLPVIVAANKHIAQRFWHVVAG
jgi:fructose-1,6-bisphosphatase/inositol monophosphatase family enzyme